MSGNSGDGSAQHTDAVERLQIAITEYGDAIRGSDLKAEVLGILVTAVFAVVNLEGQLTHATWNGWLGVLAIMFAFVSFASIGLVLWPRSNPWKSVHLEGYSPTGVLYPEAGLSLSDGVKKRAAKALGTDWLHELTYELAKVACIHKAKVKWMRVAVLASGVAILLAGLRLFLL